jgi:ACS family hexuronate transporter-like MFS transporter
MSIIPKSIGRYRWWMVAAFLLAITALNYLDRQAFPTAVSEIKKDIAINDLTFSRLNSAFLLAYALMYVGGGRLVDKLGSRFGYALIAGFWSLSCMLHAVANSVASLGAFRLMLGAGEGGGFASASKVVSEWFPVRERALAVGLFNAGGTMGGMIAPPLVAVIVTCLDWRAAFVIFGSAGLVWSALWFWLYRPPQTCTRLGESERQYLAAEGLGKNIVAPPRIRWRTLLARRQTWSLIVARGLGDAPAYFVLFWTPKYLVDAHGFDLKTVGAVAWVPFACALIGCLIAGWLSSALIAPLGLSRARKTVMAMGALLYLSALLITHLPVAGAVAVMSVLLFAHQLWTVNLQTLIMDLFPSRAVGSVTGLTGCAGALSGILLSEAVGQLLSATGGSYFIPFILVALMYPLALVVILTTLPKIEPLNLDAPAA